MLRLWQTLRFRVAKPGIQWRFAVLTREHPAAADGQPRQFPSWPSEHIEYKTTAVLHGSSPGRGFPSRRWVQALPMILTIQRRMRGPSVCCVFRFRSSSALAARVSGADARAGSLEASHLHPIRLLAPYPALVRQILLPGWRVARWLAGSDACGRTFVCSGSPVLSERHDPGRLRADIRPVAGATLTREVSRPAAQALPVHISACAPVSP